MVLVASRRGDIAGFAIMQFGERLAHLLLLAVEPRRQRAGIGSAMLAWLEKSCRTAGIEEIGLEVRATNRAALAFYRARGFRAAGRINGYYDRFEAAIRMQKPLLATLRNRNPSPDPSAPWDKC